MFCRTIRDLNNPDFDKTAYSRLGEVCGLLQNDGGLFCNTHKYRLPVYTKACLTLPLYCMGCQRTRDDYISAVTTGEDGKPNEEPDEEEKAGAFHDLCMWLYKSLDDYQEYNKTGRGTPPKDDPSQAGAAQSYARAFVVARKAGTTTYEKSVKTCKKERKKHFVAVRTVPSPIGLEMLQVMFLAKQPVEFGLDIYEFKTMGD